MLFKTISTLIYFYVFFAIVPNIKKKFETSEN